MLFMLILQVSILVIKIKFKTLDKVFLTCDAIDCNVVKGLREPILFSFILNKPAGYKLFFEPETDLNTMTFYLEDYKIEEVNFKGETITFTIQMIET